MVLITGDLIIAEEHSNDELAPTPQHRTNYLYVGTISPSLALLSAAAGVQPADSHISSVTLNLLPGI